MPEKKISPALHSDERIENLPMLRDLKKPNSYYDILKIPPHTNNKQVREAYSSLLESCENKKKSMPKRAYMMRVRLLQEAYAALRTEDSRNRYNRLLLSFQGKPKGLALRADNDNRKNAPVPSFWVVFKDKLKGQKNG